MAESKAAPEQTGFKKVRLFGSHLYAGIHFPPNFVGAVHNDFLVHGGKCCELLEENTKEPYKEPDQTVHLIENQAQFAQTIAPRVIEDTQEKPKPKTPEEVKAEEEEEKRRKQVPLASASS